MLRHSLDFQLNHFEDLLHNQRIYTSASKQIRVILYVNSSQQNMIFPFNNSTDLYLYSSCTINELNMIIKYAIRQSKAVVFIIPLSALPSKQFHSQYFGANQVIAPVFSMYHHCLQILIWVFSLIRIWSHSSLSMKLLLLNKKHLNSELFSILVVK